MREPFGIHQDARKNIGRSKKRIIMRQFSENYEIELGLDRVLISLRQEGGFKIHSVKSGFLSVEWLNKIYS